MNQLTVYVGALGMMALVGCANVDDAPSETGLRIDEQSETRIAGAFDDGVAELAFEAEEIAQGLVRIELAGAFDLVMEVDWEIGSINATSAIAPLTHEQVELFARLDTALELDREAGHAPERSLAGAVTWLTEARPGTMWHDIAIENTRSVVNISCGNYCRYLQRSCTGAWYYKQTGVDSPNCKGRCGSGCYNARSGGENVWTMDCAEHDYHLGPWGDCSDDVFGGSRQRCTSYGEFCATNCSCYDGPSC